MPAFASFVLVSRSQRCAVNCCCCYLLNKIFVLPRTNTLSLTRSLTLSCAHTHTEACIGCLPTHSHVSLLSRLCIVWLWLRLPLQQRRWRRRCAVPTATTTTRTTTTTSALLPATTCMCMSLGSAAASQRCLSAPALLQSLAPIGDYALSLNLSRFYFVNACLADTLPRIAAQSA